MRNRRVDIREALVCIVLLTGCGGGGGPSGPKVEMAPVEPSGQVRVVDADTVDIDGTRYRLFGIDAPESRQTCRAWGRTWGCGAAATEALKTWASGMSCAGSGTDRYGRTIGVCSSGGEDLNAWLVANGWALAYRQFADDYVDEENEARTGRRGMHHGEFAEPWDWRRGERLEGDDTFVWSASGGVDVDALADRLVRGDGSGFWGSVLEDSVFGLVDETIAVSFGAWSETSPTGIGRAVWLGSVVGLDGGSGQRIEGDAEIAIEDFAAAAVDIVFTGLSEAGGGTKPDLRWEDLAVAEGAFQTSGRNGSIEGRFYGAGHDEAGGVFERNGIVGAFGATRD